MKDRFKFRAWDKKNKEMVFFDFDLLNDESRSFYHHTIENSPVMQCTGLKDKNGKLIYGGDIVKYYYKPIGVPYYRKYYNIKQIFFDVTRGIGERTIARAVYTTKDMPDDLIENKFADINEYEVQKNQNIIWSYIGVGGDNYEIIGNIYESPELLTNLNNKESNE